MVASALVAARVGGREKTTWEQESVIALEIKKNRYVFGHGNRRVGIVPNVL